LARDEARRSVAAAFVIHAIVTGSWAPRLPAIKAELALSDGELGTALAGMAVGLLIGTRVAGAISDRYSSRRVIRIGLPLFCASLILPAVAWNGPTLFVGLFAMGLSGGALDVAINSHGVDVERAFDRPILGGLHGLWSVGLGVGAAGAALAAAVGVSPAPSFLVVGGVLAAVSAIATADLLPGGEDGAGAAEGRAKVRWSFVLVLLGVIAFCAFVGEGAAADWSAVYLVQQRGLEPGVAATAFLAFAVGMALARFASDSLRTRIGPVSLVRAGSALAGCGLAIGLAVDTPGAVIAGFGLLGIGLAPVVPVVFAAAGHLRTGATGRLVARVATLGYVGGVLGPVIIGWVGDEVGLRTALLMPAVLALGITALAGFALRVADRL
jgi:MFS family permease